VNHADQRPLTSRLSMHRIMVVVGAGGEIEGDLDLARVVHLADVAHSEVVHWEQHETAWCAPDAATSAATVRRIVDFVSRFRVQAIVAGRASTEVRHALAGCGVLMFQHGGISARAAAMSAAAVLTASGLSRSPAPRRRDRAGRPPRE